jgi:hypothetical protein
VNSAATCAVDTGRGDRVLAVAQVADDLGGDHLVKNTDETLDVDGVAGGDGTDGHVFAGVVANLGDVELELIVGLGGLSAHAAHLSAFALVGTGRCQEIHRALWGETVRVLQVVGHPFGGSGFRVEQTAAAFDGPNE